MIGKAPQNVDRVKGWIRATSKFAEGIRSCIFQAPGATMCEQSLRAAKQSRRRERQTDIRMQDRDEPEWNVQSSTKGPDRQDFRNNKERRGQKEGQIEVTTSSAPPGYRREIPT